MDRISVARLTTATTVLLLGMAATGCGADNDSAGSAAPSAASGSAPSTPTEDSGANLGRLFTEDPTIVGTHPIPFTTWTRVGEDRIAVDFQTGSPECYGVDATVTETEKSVVVQVRSGTKASAVGRMCTMVAVFGTLEVTLKSPLGDRQVLSAV